MAMNGSMNGTGGRCAPGRSRIRGGCGNDEQVSSTYTKPPRTIPPKQRLQAGSGWGPGAAVPQAGGPWSPGGPGVRGGYRPQQIIPPKQRPRAGGSWSPGGPTPRSGGGYQPPLHPNINDRLSGRMSGNLMEPGGASVYSYDPRDYGPDLDPYNERDIQGRTGGRGGPGTGHYNQ